MGPRLHRFRLPNSEEYDHLRLELGDDDKCPDSSEKGDYYACPTLSAEVTGLMHKKALDNGLAKAWQKLVQPRPKMMMVYRTHMALMSVVEAEAVEGLVSLIGKR